MIGSRQLARPRPATPTDGVPRFVHADEPRHGVVTFGVELQAAVEQLSALRPALLVGVPDLTHLQFSDSLWGRDTAYAADRTVELMATLRGQRVVTFHDVPDPLDAPDRLARRRASYRRVADAADLVVVSTPHEAAWASALGSTTRVVMIPNAAPQVAPGTTRPVAVEPTAGSHRDGAVHRGDQDRRDQDRLDAGRPPRLGLLGWIHPGKGYDKVISRLSHDAVRQVVLIGAVVEGHADHVAALADLAARRDIPLRVTGYLSPEAQRAQMDAVDVAVVPHPRPAASGSVLTWIAAGRQPLVRRSPLSDTLLRRCPGSVRTYDGDLVGALPGACRATLGPLPEELQPRTAARRHLAVYRTLR